VKQTCLACDIEKDTSVKEVYPYPDDGIRDDEPINPLMTLDCQGPSAGDGSDWRVVVVCHACFHKLDVDMWISDRCWRSLNPVVPFEQLPKLDAKPWPA